MANVEDEHTPGPARGGRRVARSWRADRPATGRRRRDRPRRIRPAAGFYDSSFRNIAEGEVVKGTVLKVTPSEVIVDVGYKSEGIIAVDEFLDENGQITVEAGDIVDVLLERTEDREGYVVLSREKAEKMKIWDEVEKAYAERKVVIGRVIERIKGGLAVDIGVRAFLPGSQIDVRPVRNLDALRGQELRMRVIKVNKKRGNIVLSRKALLEEENAEKKKHTLETLAEGKVLQRRRQEHHRLRRVHRPRRHRRPAAHHRHVVGPRRPSVGALQGQRRDRRRRAQVRPGDRARVARPQAAHHRSVGERDGSLPGRRAHGRQGRQPDRLRRVRRARVGRRRPDPRLRDVVEQARQAPVEDPQRRRHGRRDGARRRSDGAAHFARPEAGRDQSVARPGRQVSGRLEDPGQGPQPHRVRRVRRGRRGHRRPHPHLGHVVEQARSSTRRKSSRRATWSTRWCSTSTPRTSGCRSA